ncbi:MAG: insulinase family protein [Firmicutes bacterium]|nr:insulinase family protein [Bacillota bacterium]
MKKIPLSKVDVDVFYEKLDNGLEVYISPKNNVNNIYVTYSTKYGSNQNDFVPIGKNKMITVPLGIAHFLEHQLFNQEDGTDVMTFFSERGTDVNANTNKIKTTYLFSGPDFFEENLKFLLEYVEKPYFTDDSVQKEKGIIEQEIKMYQDKPFTRLYEGITYNAFHKHPIKYPVIGTIESINKITKEDLYTCYNTFYHPSNMVLVITGNVDCEKTIEIIKEHENKRNLEKAKPIKLETYNEEDTVAKKSEEINLNVTIPKVAIAFKINVEKLKKVPKTEITTYLQMLFSLKLGVTSEFGEKLKEERIITTSIDSYVLDADKHALVIVATESKEPKEFIKRVKKYLVDLTITEEELERRKKAYISEALFASDRIIRINHKIMNNVVKYNKLFTNDIEIIESYNIDKMNYIIKNINLDNYTNYIVNPLK